MRLGALNWGVFLQAQPDTPGKLAAFAFAAAHLEAAGYEQLARVAQRAGDGETERVAQRNLAEEQADWPLGESADGPRRARGERAG